MTEKFVRKSKGEMPMTIFEAVKSTVTPRMAAEHYGMTVARNGMVCCPFHNDRHPSMKLNEDYFYCFGCGAKGDVIEFTSKLFGITAMEAAQKLRADFGVQEDKPSILTKLNLYRTQADNERLCFRVLREYLQILQDWKVRFSPQTLEDDPDDRFVEACHISPRRWTSSKNISRKTRSYLPWCIWTRKHPICTFVLSR